MSYIFIYLSIYVSTILMFTLTNLLFQKLISPTVNFPVSSSAARKKLARLRAIQHALGIYNIITYHYLFILRGFSKYIFLI